MKIAFILALGLGLAVAQPALAQPRQAVMAYVGAIPPDGKAADILSTTASDLPLGGYREFDGRLSRQAPLESVGWAPNGYVAYAADGGFYAQASTAWLGKAGLNRIGRGLAYRPRVLGRAKSKGWAASGELGWQFDAGALAVTPFAALDYVDAKLDGYVATGASASALAFPDRNMKQLTASFGGELAADLGPLRPALRGGYSLERDSGGDNAAARLASDQPALGDCAFAELRVAMRSGPLLGYVSGGSRWGRNGDDARVSLGLSYGF